MYSADLFFNVEGLSTNKHDHNLTSNHDDIDDDEEPVVCNTFENVEFAIESSVVVLVENLQPDESVENKWLELLELNLSIEVKDLSAGEMEDKSNDQLVDCLPDNHLPHGEGNEWRLLWLWFPLEDRSGWRIGSKSQCGKSIHDKIDPEKLYCSKNGFLLVTGNCRNKGDQDCSNVDSQLELKIGQ